MADMIVVTAIDLDEPRIAQSLAIIGTVESVYASTTQPVRRHVTLRARVPHGLAVPMEPPLFLTDIHQIRIATDAMTIVGSASIEGFLGTIPTRRASA